MPEYAGSTSERGSTGGQADSPVGDDVVREQRADKDADPEQDNEDAKHAKPSSALAADIENAPADESAKGMGGTEECGELRSIAASWKVNMASPSTSVTGSDGFQGKVPARLAGAPD